MKFKLIAKLTKKSQNEYKYLKYILDPESYDREDISKIASLDDYLISSIDNFMCAIYDLVIDINYLKDNPDKFTEPVRKELMQLLRVMRNCVEVMNDTYDDFIYEYTHASIEIQKKHSYGYDELMENLNKISNKLYDELFTEAIMNFQGKAEDYDI